MRRVIIMCKLNTWFVVKSLVFVGGVATIYKLGKAGEKVEIDGQQFTVYGKTAKQFVQDIMEQKDLISR